MFKYWQKRESTSFQLAADLCCKMIICIHYPVKQAVGWSFSQHAQGARRRLHPAQAAGLSQQPIIVLVAAASSSSLTARSLFRWRP